MGQTCAPVTTTTTAAAATITSNTCTSGWTGITILYHCYNNCTVRSSYVQYTYTYVAIANTTGITFALRDDIYYFSLDNITVWNNAAPNTQLLLNGGFKTGILTPWIYCNPQNASHAGQLETGNVSDGYYTYMPYSGSNFYLDGSVGNTDYLTQTFSTKIGDTYTISVWLYNPGAVTGVSVDVLMST
ncbi:unnamed protein product [Rotaria sp. Silwood2]|nr:unnamed protein product [Rotaria sp. Silwood2]